MRSLSEIEEAHVACLSPPISVKTPRLHVENEGCTDKIHTNPIATGWNDEAPCIRADARYTTAELPKVSLLRLGWWRSLYACVAKPVVAEVQDVPTLWPVSPTLSAAIYTATLLSKGCL
jgi:hypothetical protein